MTPVLVIGKTGQMAQALALKGGSNVVCLGRPDADLTNAASLARALDEYRPGVVINTGAFTAVDVQKANRKLPGRSMWPGRKRWRRRALSGMCL